jgi:hypothetical protein
MAARRKEGVTFSSIACEFGTTSESVRGKIVHVERYDRGMQILRDNPASLEGLQLIRELHTLAAKSLFDRGYRTLHDLDGLRQLSAKIRHQAIWRRRAVQSVRAP